MACPRGPACPLLVPADELQCACDVPYCSVPTCTGKVCFVSKRKEEGVITQHRGCFSQNIPENCQTAVMEQYGLRCCDSSMCNAELEIFLQGTGPRSLSRSWGERGRAACAAGDGVGSPDHPRLHSAPRGPPFPRGDRASEMSSHVPSQAGPAELPAMGLTLTQSHPPQIQAQAPKSPPFPVQTRAPRPSPCQGHLPSPTHRFQTHPGEEALGKTPSLLNLLLMIFVPLLALLILAVLMVLFCWRVARHRHKKSDLGDMDLMLKASMAGDSTLEVGELQEGSQPPLREGGHASCGVASGVTPLLPRLHRTC